MNEDRQIKCPHCLENIKFLCIVKINGEDDKNKKEVYACPKCHKKIANDRAEADKFMGVK